MDVRVPTDIVLKAFAMLFKCSRMGGLVRPFEHAHCAADFIAPKTHLLCQPVRREESVRVREGRNLAPRRRSASTLTARAAPTLRAVPVHQLAECCATTAFVPSALGLEPAVMAFMPTPVSLSCDLRLSAF